MFYGNEDRHARQDTEVQQEMSQANGRAMPELNSLPKALDYSPEPELAISDAEADACDCFMQWASQGDQQRPKSLACAKRQSSMGPGRGFKLLLEIAG